MSSPVQAQAQTSPQAERLRATLGNREWLERNNRALRATLPPIWSHINDPEVLLRLGITLKMLGVDWHDTNELPLIVHWLHRLGMAEIEPATASCRVRPVLLVRRRPKS